MEDHKKYVHNEHQFESEFLANTYFVDLALHRPTLQAGKPKRKKNEPLKQQLTLKN
jgi:hypothetical protein